MSSEEFPMISVTEAANQLGVTTGRVRQLLRDGTLKGRHLTSHCWMVDARSLKSVKDRPKSKRFPGRPKISEKKC